MPADTEKITINVSVVDLGKIDLLVDEGSYAGRTDFVRTAIRGQLDKQSELGPAVARGAYVVGVLSYDRDRLEHLASRRERVRIVVLGMLVIGRDVAPELAASTIESIKVRGVFRASPEIKAALADRMQ